MFSQTENYKANALTCWNSLSLSLSVLMRVALEELFHSQLFESSGAAQSLVNNLLF